MGKYLQEICTSCCFFSDLTDYERILYLLSQSFYLKRVRLRPRKISDYVGQSSLSAIKVFLFIKHFLPAKPDVARKSEDWWRERDSNPRCPFRNIHDFQSCSFNHSDTSPLTPRYVALRAGTPNKEVFIRALL